MRALLIIFIRLISSNKIWLKRKETLNFNLGASYAVGSLSLQRQVQTSGWTRQPLPHPKNTIYLSSATFKRKSIKSRQKVQKEKLLQRCPSRWLLPQCKPSKCLHMYPEQPLSQLLRTATKMLRLYKCALETYRWEVLCKLFKQVVIEPFPLTLTRWNLWER